MRGALSRAVTHQIFEAATMRAVAKDLLAMKVTKLKEELEARGAGPRASLGQKKAWLRRRLHAAIVREHRREREEAPQKIAHLEARQLIHLYVFTGILCICTLIHFYGRRPKLIRTPPHG